MQKLIKRCWVFTCKKIIHKERQQTTIPSFRGSSPPLRKFRPMQDAISKLKLIFQNPTALPLVDKTQLHRQLPNMRFFAYKRFSLVRPYLANQTFNLISLTETLN